MNQICLSLTLIVAVAVFTTEVSGQCACNDGPPPAGEGKEQYSCAQQKEWNKCSEGFMLSFCECTCDRCCPCNDSPPPEHPYTCAQQKEFGKCDEEFMKGYCECTCGRCNNGGSVVSPPVSGCANGLVPIFGSDKCETKRCSANRQRCGDQCGGLQVIKFDCKDTGNAFGSSCACAGK